MAFFQKLKERLFKSSAKIEEGLDAILDEAPAAAAPARRASPPTPPPEPEAARPGAGRPAARRRRRAGCSTTPCSRASRSC